MDTDQAFKSIMENIKDEKFDLVRPQIDAILGSTDDPMLMLKCASLLKTIDDEKGCQEIIGRVLDSLPDDKETVFSIAMSVRSLGRITEALDIAEDYLDDDSKKVEIARTYHLAGENKDALAILKDAKGLSSKDRILLCEVMCSLKMFDDAEREAASIIEDDGGTYASYVNYVYVLMSAGKVKEANKYAKSHLKEDKKNVDSLALQAYVMWINGKVPAAANYANRALQIDYSHFGALETMAMCLITKGKYTQAKILAGVINEKDPAEPAVIRILDACRVASNGRSS